MHRFLILATLTTSLIWAQIPFGYYNAASGLDGDALQQALHDIIDDHQQQSYSSLHGHYESTDARSDGTVWDMYSDVPGGTPPYTYNFTSGDQCGNYGGEGDCYNREHSWPKSWFNDQYPMYSDLFHVVPSDGYVNGQRSNWPYGEVSNPNWTSQNGSKVGPNTYPGYTGTAFEPIDAYKGDFARIYFYMSTRYLNEDAGWSGSPMANGAQLESWALDMMMDWHAGDPVSDKEIDRNNAVYLIQENRNPFVDHPEYADLIWGEVLPLPEAPSQLSASNISETALDLSWTDNASDESGFYVYQNGSRIATLDQNITSFTVSDLQPSTTYTFGVSAFNENGETAQTSHTAATLGGGGSTVTHFFEDFESAGGSSYIDGEITLPSGVWSAYQAGNFSLGTPYSGDACLSINDDKSGAHITTPAVNGLGLISFYYYQRNGSATDEFQVLKSVDGGAFELVATQSYNVGESYTFYSLMIEDSSTSIRMKIMNDDQSGHLILDDLTVTAYAPVGTASEPVQTPGTFKVTSVYPNPFNPRVSLVYEVPHNTRDLALEVYDLRGMRIASLAPDRASGGSQTVSWDGNNSAGAAQPSGIYIVHLSDGSHSDMKRITLLR